MTDTQEQIPPYAYATPRSPTATGTPVPASQQLTVIDFSSLRMSCPINAQEISNRWLKAYMTDPQVKAKQYSAPIVSFIHRILKSYTAATVRGEGIPAFVHNLQISRHAPQTTLTTCLSLVRTFNGPVDAALGPLTDIMLRELDNIYTTYATLDTFQLVCAFQATFIYALVLYFYVGETHPSLWEAMMNLQSIASASSQQAIMSTAETQHARPRWEEWIVAESQRRTLYTMYMFDSLLSSRAGLPTFLGTELKGLSAPGNSTLWRAAGRDAWDKEYNLHIARWPEGGLRLDELWPMPPEFDDAAIAQTRQRVDQWLINADEYGTMLYAVTSCTHGT